MVPKVSLYQPKKLSLMHAVEAGVFQLASFNRKFGDLYSKERSFDSGIFLRTPELLSGRSKSRQRGNSFSGLQHENKLRLHYNLCHKHMHSLDNG